MGLLALSTELVAALHDMSARYDLEPDLSPTLTSTWQQLRATVPSALGFTVAVQTDCFPPVRVTQVQAPLHPSRVGASLQVPLRSGPSAAHSTASVVFYAETPGALVDLGADLAYLQGLSLDVLVVDQPLGTRLIQSGITGLASYSTIHMAIGILIAQGHTPSRAEAHFDPDPGSWSVNVDRAVEIVARTTTQFHDPRPDVRPPVT